MNQIIEWDEFKSMYDSLIDVLWDFQGINSVMSSTDRWALVERNGDKIAEIEEFISPMRDNIAHENWQ